MAKTDQQPEATKTLYFFPDLDGQSVSVEATSQEEALKLAKQQLKQQGGAADPQN